MQRETEILRAAVDVLSVSVFTLAACSLREVSGGIYVPPDYRIRRLRIILLALEEVVGERLQKRYDGVLLLISQAKITEI